MVRHLAGLAALAATAALLAVVYGGLPSSSAAANGRVARAHHAKKHHAKKAATVTTRKIKKLGTVLVNSRGLTLYMFVPDKRKRVTCKGTCAAVWPPLKLKKGQKATAGGGVRKKLLGTDKNPGGGLVATYNRWPLYTYVGDTKPGQVKGQALDLNGGLWYVLSPAGKVIKKKP